MKSHRTISLTLTFLAVFVTFAPAAAVANSLLSGYGAPGEGNQAILGSALVGGAGASGSGGSTGGHSGSNGSSGSSGASSSEATDTSAQGGGGETATGATGDAGVAGGHGSAARGSNTRGSGARDAGRRSAGRRAGSQDGSGKASAGAAHAYPVLSRDDASRSVSGGSGGLGFSAEDLGYLLVALGALAVTGVVTKRLARSSVRPEGL